MVKRSFFSERLFFYASKFGYVNTKDYIRIIIKTHKPMKKLNYDKLMALKPTIYNGFRNTLGQLVQLAEHPTRGDEYPVIAIFRDQKVAFCTDFFDTSDMYKGSDYEPITIAGDCICKFEL